MNHKRGITAFSLVLFILSVAALICADINGYDPVERVFLALLCIVSAGLFCTFYAHE
jgi:hypothetical protein